MWTSPAGSPYINVTGSDLAVRGIVAVTLEFTNPTNKGITYTTRVLAGPGQPWAWLCYVGIGLVVLANLPAHLGGWPLGPCDPDPWHWVLGAFTAVVLAAFSAIALALSLTGLYAVCSYLVQSRTREIGLRMALGAQGSVIVRQFIGRALRLTGVGVLIGLALAFALRSLLASFLFEIPSSDWLSYGGAASLLTLGAITASFVPAWRASRTDPAVVLREE